MTQISEAKLVAAIRRGDQAALGDLLSRYQNRLYNICLRMVGDRDDAAELTQEAMLRIIQHIGDHQGHSALSTWMIRIVMNLSISHLRKRRRRHTVSLDADYTHSGGGDGSGGGGDGEDQTAALRRRMADFREPCADQSVETHEMLEHLHEAMDRLDDDHKAVLVLRDIDELDYQQIAELLVIPVGTVKSRLFRARLALRELMMQRYPSQRPESPLTAPRPQST